MKISKLFHWLYAVLMFLPLLVFLPTGFYYAFNDNAQAQEYTKEEPIYYQSNEVTSNSDLIIGNIYEFVWVGNNTTIPNFTFECFDIIPISGSFLPHSSTPSYTIPYFRNGGGNDIVVIYGVDADYNLYNSFKLVFTLKNIILADNNIYESIHETDYTLVKEYQEVTYTMGITDSMANAWNHTWELPLFSWSQDTFLNQPFNYITNLFSIPNGSTFANAFGYWLSLSICWLVFDVIMYVPMLVHRWIDKARIE